MKISKYLIGLLILFAMCFAGCGGGSGGSAPTDTTITINKTAPNSTTSYNNDNLDLSIALDFKGISSDVVTISNLTIKRTVPNSSDITSSIVPFGMYDEIYGDSARYYIKGVSKLPANTTDTDQKYEITGKYSVSGGALKDLPKITISVSAVAPVEPTVTVNESAPSSSLSYNSDNLNLSIALDFKGISSDVVTFSNLTIKRTVPSSSDVTSSIAPYGLYTGIYGDSTRYYIKGTNRLPANTTASTQKYEITGKYTVSGGTSKDLPKITISVLPEIGEQSVNKISPTTSAINSLGEIVSVKVRLNDTNKTKTLNYVWTINGSAAGSTIVDAEGIDSESPTTGKERTYTQRVKINNTGKNRAIVLKVYINGTSTLVGEVSYTQEYVKPTPPPT